MSRLGAILLPGSVWDRIAGQEMEAIPVHYLKAMYQLLYSSPSEAAVLKGCNAFFKSPNWESQQADNYQQNV